MSARIMPLRRPDPRNELSAHDAFLLEAEEAAEWQASLEAAGIHYPACTSDACAQGRKRCPTPEACEVSDFEPLGIREERWVTRIALVIAMGVLLFLAAERFGMLP